MDEEQKERDHDYEREKWEEDHCPECRALVDVHGNCRCLVDEDPPCSEVGGAKSDCPHWQNGCCICDGSEHRKRGMIVAAENTQEPKRKMSMMTWMATEGGRKCPACGKYARAEDLGWIGSNTPTLCVDMYGHLPGKGCNQRKEPRP